MQRLTYTVVTRTEFPRIGFCFAVAAALMPLVIALARIA